jgi:hypothetical protein
MHDSLNLFQKDYSSTLMDLVMRKLTLEKNLVLKITKGGQTKLNKWFEIISQDNIEEQAIEDRVTVDTFKDKFYTNLHDDFLCTIPSLLHIFLLDKGVEYIYKYRRLLKTQFPNCN